MANEMHNLLPNDGDIKAFAAEMVKYYSRIEKEYNRIDSEWQRSKAIAKELYLLVNQQSFDERQAMRLKTVLEAEKGQHGTGWYEMLKWLSEWIIAKQNL
jgi:hypothetical protein